MNSAGAIFKTSVKIAGAVLMTALIGCVNGPCRQVRSPELASQQQAQPTGSASGVTAEKGAQVSANPNQKTTGRVFVSKPDGSLQCGMGKAISVEEMEKQLAGIQVFSREKRPDGMMHIQVCGSPTGMVNVYEIPEGSLSAAVAKGFKRFDSK